MQVLNEILTWVVEIAGALVVVIGALLWMRAATQEKSTARSFMALVFTVVFYLVVVLGASNVDEGTIRVLAVSYAGVVAVYIVARTVEEMRRGK